MEFIEYFKQREKVLINAVGEKTWKDEKVYFVNEINEIVKEWQLDFLNLHDVTVAKHTFCNLYKKECMGKLCSVTTEPDKCYHLRLQNAR